MRYIIFKWFFQSQRTFEYFDSSQRTFEYFDPFQKNSRSALFLPTRKIVQNPLSRLGHIKLMTHYYSSKLIHAFYYFRYSDRSSCIFKERETPFQSTWRDTLNWQSSATTFKIPPTITILKALVPMVHLNGNSVLFFSNNNIVWLHVETEHHCVKKHTYIAIETITYINVFCILIYATQSIPSKYWTLLLFEIIFNILYKKFT